jgi:hypothetical protein
MEERISAMYDTQVTQMKKQIELLSTQLKTYELENKDLIDKEVNKAREKFELLLQEKEELKMYDSNTLSSEEMEVLWTLIKDKEQL